MRTNNPAKTKSSSPRLRQTSEHPLTEEVQLNDGEEEVQDSMSDNLVRMIKQIDTQTLKRRLDLDKLDEHLDTDDEVGTGLYGSPKFNNIYVNVIVFSIVRLHS